MIGPLARRECLRIDCRHGVNIEAAVVIVSDRAVADRCWQHTAAVVDNNIDDLERQSRHRSEIAKVVTGCIERWFGLEILRVQRLRVVVHRGDGKLRLACPSDQHMHHYVGDMRIARKPHRVLCDKICVLQALGSPPAEKRFQ